MQVMAMATWAHGVGTGIPCTSPIYPASWYLAAVAEQSEQRLGRTRTSPGSCRYRMKPHRRSPPVWDCMLATCRTSLHSPRAAQYSPAALPESNRQRYAGNAQCRFYLPPLYALHLAIARRLPRPPDHIAAPDRHQTDRRYSCHPPYPTPADNV
jgi:hypothetical protein